MAGLGFFDKRIQLPGMCVRRNFLIPKRFAVFQQPIGHRMNILGFKLCDCGFNFLHSTHGGKVSDWRMGDNSTSHKELPHTTSFLKRREKGGAVEFRDAGAADSACFGQLARHLRSAALAHDKFGLSVGRDGQLLAFRQAINQPGIAVKLTDRNSFHFCIAFTQTIYARPGRKKENSGGSGRGLYLAERFYVPFYDDMAKLKCNRVFILGAGCSANYGYPLDGKLVDELRKFLLKIPNGCPVIQEAVSK